MARPRRNPEKAILRGKTSTETKREWNKQAYDRLSITVKKGKRDMLNEYCKNRGTTLNSLVNYLLDEETGIRDEDVPDSAAE